jgi:hypothetical protein
LKESHDAFTIRGKKKIERYIRKQLDCEARKFREQIRGRESKFLFVLLQSLNYFVGAGLLREQDGVIDKLDIPIYRLFVSLKAMLDLLLQSRISVVQMISNDEFLDIFAILRQHLKIGVLKQMVFVQNAYPTNIMEVRDGEIVRTREDSSELYQAFQSWVDVAGLDSDWMNWYFGRFQEKRARVGTLLRRDFKELHLLELDDLTCISEFLKDISVEHIQKTKWSISSTPFLYIKRRRLEKEFAKHMSQKDARKWIKLLEYRQGGDFYKLPLFPLNFKGQKIYTLMTWVFTPSNHFWGAWITDMLIDNLGFSSRGKWAAQYGLAFQNYVDQRLKESKLPIENLGSRKILARDHPEIRPWLDRMQQREGFEIDRLVKCGNVVFVVSCKARDFLFDRIVVRRAIFFPTKELEERIARNMEDVSKVQSMADCVKCCEEMRNKLGLYTDTFVAVLLTSMKEPLSCPEVRAYYTEKRRVRLPEAHIVTIPQFIELIRKEACVNHGLV